jgi:hypothetical protein
MSVKMMLARIVRMQKSLEEVKKFLESQESPAPKKTRVKLKVTEKKKISRNVKKSKIRLDPKKSILRFPEGVDFYGRD